MPQYKVAHIKEQSVDLIIVPLESRFGNMSSQDQRTTVASLQAHASRARLGGTVVPVWDSGGGRMAFPAPHQWRGFFSSINLPWVWTNVNKEPRW